MIKFTLRVKCRTLAVIVIIWSCRAAGVPRILLHCGCLLLRGSLRGWSWSVSSSPSNNMSLSLHKLLGEMNSCLFVCTWPIVWTIWYRCGTWCSWVSGYSLKRWFKLEWYLYIGRRCFENECLKNHKLQMMVQHDAADPHSLQLIFCGLSSHLYCL